MKPTLPPTSHARPAASRPAAGLAIRSGLQAGAWRCNDCDGKVMGSQLFKPTCAFCQRA
ncbi:MAG: hypothetical protein ACKOC5_03905 [Chloroflexota bacterium]